MRIIEETITGAGFGQDIHIGKENKCLVIMTALSGGTCDLSVQLHVDVDTYIQVNNAAAKDVDEIVDLEDYAGNLPEQSVVRVEAAGSFTSMTYKMLVGDLLNHGVSD